MTCCDDANFSSYSILLAHIVTADQSAVERRDDLSLALNYPPGCPGRRKTSHVERFTERADYVTNLIILRCAQLKSFCAATDAHVQ